MPYTARYIFSLEDYRALLAVARSQKRFGYWPLRAVFTGMLFLAWVVPRIFTGPSGGPGPGALQPALDLLPFVILYAVWELLVFHTSLPARLAYRRCSMAGEPVTYELSEKGVAWTRTNMRGEYGWPAFAASAVTPGGVALLIGKREWLLIPPRAFASQAGFEAAASLAMAKVAAKKAAQGV